MWDFSSVIWFTLISELLLEIFHLVISVGFQQRETITGDSDQSVTDGLMKYLSKSHCYSTSYLRTTRCVWPTGLVVGKSSKLNFWFAYIEVSYPNDSRGRNYTFKVRLYSNRKIIIPKGYDCEEISGEGTVVNVDGAGASGGAEVRGEIQVNMSTTTLVTYRKYGSWKGNDYHKMELCLRPDLVSPEQKFIIDGIERMVETSYRNGFSYGGFFMVNGCTGSGKSTLGRFLAHRLNANFCDDFRLTEPGYNLYQLLQTVEATRETPLVLVLEEFDRDLERVHKEQVEAHKWLSTSISDKASWNTFADQLVDNPNLIVLATTNRTKEWFDSMDESYLRTGRMNRIFTLSQVKGISLAEQGQRLRFGPSSGDITRGGTGITADTAWNKNTKTE